MGALKKIEIEMQQHALKVDQESMVEFCYARAMFVTDAEEAEIALMTSCLRKDSGSGFVPLTREDVAIIFEDWNRSSL
jgi:hypothetical protein